MRLVSKALSSVKYFANTSERAYVSMLAEWETWCNMDKDAQGEVGKPQLEVLIQGASAMRSMACLVVAEGTSEANHVITMARLITESSLRPKLDAALLSFVSDSLMAVDEATKMFRMTLLERETIVRFVKDSKLHHCVMMMLGSNAASPDARLHDIFKHVKRVLDQHDRAVPKKTNWPHSAVKMAQRTLALLEDRHCAPSHFVVDVSRASSLAPLRVNEAATTATTTILPFPRTASLGSPCPHMGY